MAEAIAIDVWDETTTGERRKAVTLRLASERLTLRELIRRRVRQEVEDYNRAQPEVFAGLVQPTDTERVLNGYKMRKPRLLDPDAQCDAAVEAFQRNGFFIVVGDKQVDGLDEEIVLTPKTDVRFLKLVPLVGG